MLQLYPVYLLWNRRKTLTGSPDPTRANGTNKPCISAHFSDQSTHNWTPLSTNSPVASHSLCNYTYCTTNHRPSLTDIRLFINHIINIHKSPHKYSNISPQDIKRIVPMTTSVSPVSLVTLVGCFKFLTHRL